MRTPAFLSSIALVALSLGCWVEPANDRASRGAPTPAAPRPATEQPRLSIDTGRTLHATPGGGAGLFVSYQSGGGWKLEWSCDTNVNRGSTCPFEIAVGAQGLVTRPEASPAAALVESDATSFRIRTTTTTTLDSVSFSTEPGAPIALSMRLRGQPYPSLVFFVSNGGLSTAPTDPIELVPSEP
jgi:hypothetical protein